MPESAAATTTDTTILTAPPNPSTGDAPKADSGTPNAKPNEPAANAATPTGSGTDSPQVPKADEKPTEAKPVVKAPEVPEKYDLKVPEGMELDPQATANFTALGKELKLSNDQAQKLLNFQIQFSQKVTEQQDQEYQAMKKTWEDESRKFLGPNASVELAYAAKARDKFGSPELTAILNESGLGSHPAVVKYFVAIGKAISEDTFPEGKSQGQSEKTVAEMLYPNLPKGY